MELPATKALEVLTTELAYDMHRLDLIRRGDPAFKERSHHVDFVSGQVLPVLAVSVAFVAVEVCRIVPLVPPHLLVGLEELLTTGMSALDLMTLLEWDVLDLSLGR